MTAPMPSTRGEIREQHGSMEEVWLLPADEATLLDLFNDCFAEWEHINIGPLIQGAAWEIRPPREPKITTLDGYATVDFQDWHFHICIGPHKGAIEELRQIRPTARAEMYRGLKNDAANTWGVRLFNGAEEQQITFMLPNPFLTDDQQIRDEPDWERLALWDRLRAKYLGLSEPDPVDRTSKGFRHG